MNEGKGTLSDIDLDGGVVGEDKEKGDEHSRFYRVVKVIQERQSATILAS